MENLKRFSLFWLVLSSSYQSLSSDFQFRPAALELFEQFGLENIEIGRNRDNEFVIRYENRVFRNELYGAGIVIASFSELLSDSVKVVLIPKKRNIEIGCIKVRLDLYKAFVVGQLSDSSFAASIIYFDTPSIYYQKILKLKRSRSYLKFDLIFHPGIALQFGNYDDPYKENYNLIPEVITSLWKGASLQVRITIPLKDEIKLYTDEPRLTTFVFSQLFRNRKIGWIDFKAGVFDPDRWGLSAEWAHFLWAGRALVGMNRDYTGFFLHQNKVINYSDLSTNTGKIFAYYYFHRFDLSIGVNYAKYLYGEHGPMFEINRTFTDLEIGFFAAKTNIDKFAGIRVKMPLPPKRHGRPKRLRLNLPYYYQWQYQSTSLAHTFGQTTQTGVSVRSGRSIKEVYNNFILSYIKNNITMWKEAYDYVIKQNITE